MSLHSSYRFSLMLGLVLGLTACVDHGSDSEESREPVAESGGATATPETASPPERKVFVMSERSGLTVTMPGEEEPRRGRFLNFVGKFEIEDGKLVKRGQNFVTIDMASMRTNDEELAERLKVESGLDVERFPIARFQVIEVVPGEGDEYEVTGILDLHGVGKKITFPAKLSMTGRETLLDMSAEFTIRPGDFGLAGSPGEEESGEVTLAFEGNAMPGEPKELVLNEVVEQPAPGGGRFGRDGKGFGKGKGRPDWRNMSEEERAERRRQFMAEIDKNKDGNIGKDEVSERMWSFMGRGDKNGDNMLSQQEREEWRAEMRAQWEMRQLSGEGGFGPPRGGRDGGGRDGGKGRGDRPGGN